MSAPYYGDGTVTVWAGDCLDVLRGMPDASVDAVVTDPPYGLEFMGKEWDKFDRTGPESFNDTYKNAPAGVDRDAYGRIGGHPRWSTMGPKAMVAFQAWCQLWATECLRVLKPGGHMLAFGGTRTSHRLACAIEDAGFEIRDSIAWLYGSGFPKSLDVSKAIDRAAGAERSTHVVSAAYGPGHGNYVNPVGGRVYIETGGPAPATDAARTWQGWGTALKPAHEPIVVARKPLGASTVAGNVLAWGTGGLNVDGCRIGTDGGTARSKPRGIQSKETGWAENDDGQIVKIGAGRWPANVVLDESQADALDAMSGELTAKGRYLDPSEPIRRGERGGRIERAEFLGHADDDTRRNTYAGDSGGAARFFYTAKAGSEERVRLDAVAHPTVKPLALMRWLVRLVTPPGGVCLDPFAGSGTTVEAAILEGFRAIGIERETDYLPLITQRIHRRRDPAAYVKAAGEDGGLFDLLDDGGAA